MWIVKLALCRMYTFVVAALLIVVLGGFSIYRMSTDKDAGHRVHYRTVQIGHDFGSETEVLAGIDPGETVVINPGDGLPGGDGGPTGCSFDKEGGVMKWVTRENARVDRIACPWLIRRSIDRDAEFLYVAAEEVMAVAEREGAIPYDVPGVEFGHVDGRCSFESILLKYDLAGNSALTALAKIVHAADVAADVDTDPAGWGLSIKTHERSDASDAPWRNPNWGVR